MPLQEALAQINGLYGMEEYKQFCEKLVRTSENLKTMYIKQVPLPNLIFAADPGCGVTLHIRLLSDLLHELKLMDFIGEEDCFEWALSDGDEGMKRLFLRLRRAAGFYGQFKGIIGLDVGKLIEGKEKVPSFRNLMEFAEAEQGNILFIIIIPHHVPEALQKQLVGRFASYPPVELIHMPFPWSEAQYYITDQLYSRGLIVTKSAQQKLKQAVKKLSGSPVFEGYQTLQNLTDEIVWRKISQPFPTDEKITAEDVKFILDKDGYYDTLNAHGKIQRRVGFGEGEEKDA